MHACNIIRLLSVSSCSAGDREVTLHYRGVGIGSLGPASPPAEKRIKEEPGMMEVEPPQNGRSPPPPGK